MYYYGTIRILHRKQIALHVCNRHIIRQEEFIKTLIHYNLVLSSPMFLGSVTDGNQDGESAPIEVDMRWPTG